MYEQPPSLLDLAQKKFSASPLSAAEATLFRKIECGEVASAIAEVEADNDLERADGWDSSRAIRAECITWLCTDPQAVTRTTHRGIRIWGVRVEGQFDLSNATVNFPIVAWKCLFTDDIILRDAELRLFSLPSCRTKAILADRVRVKGAVFLRANFQSSGEVRLLQASIDGDLDCDSAHFSNPAGTALNADAVSVSGTVFLRNGFTAEGGVRFLRASIGRALTCYEARFTNPGGTALDADGATVGGSVHFRDGFHAEGTVRLLGLRVGGNLDCSGGRFSNAKAVALDADAARIEGNCFMRNKFEALGAVRMLSIQIGGNLELDGAQLWNEGGEALNADGADVNGAVFLRNGFNAKGEVKLLGATIGGNLECDRGYFGNASGQALVLEASRIAGGVFLRSGFVAEGIVNMLAARVGASVECDGAVFSNRQGVALNVDRATVEGSMFIRNGTSVDGELDLSGASIEKTLQIRDIREPAKMTLDLRWASVGVLWDDQPSWPHGGRLFLDGFDYSRLYEKAPFRAENRIDWLRRQPPGMFLPQPYEHLASVLRQMGHERDARSIMVEKNRAKARFTRFPRQDWLWYRLFGRAIGFGYRPLRALGLSIAMVIIGALIFGLGFSQHLISPAKAGAFEKQSITSVRIESQVADEYPVFNPFAYSLETFVPFLKFDQASSWQPNANRGDVMHFWRISVTTGALLRYYLWAHIISGWILTSLWVGAVTGLVKT